jgi:hypothetical protein
MAGEIVTTTTTLGDFIQTEAIEPTMLAYARPAMVLTPLMRRFSLVGKGSDTLGLPRFAAPVEPDDNGASGDTEFDGTEADALTATAISDDGVTATLAEYAFYTTVSDRIGEDSPLGTEVLSGVIAVAAGAIQDAVEIDALSKFTGLTASVGTTTAPLTIAQAMAAEDGIRDRGFRAPNGTAYVLGTNQAKNLRDALIAAGAAPAVYQGPATEMLGVSASPNNGMADNLVFFFNRRPVYATGIGPTANVGADEVGACFIPTGAQNDNSATFGYVASARTFRVASQEYVEGRGQKVVVSHRSANAELSDDSGTKIVSDLG